MTRTQVSFPSPSTLKKFPHVHADPSTLSQSLDPFTITTSTGFLPYATAPTTLPEAFKALASLVERAPVVMLDGKPGLLATYELGPAVESELTDLTDEVEKLRLADGSYDKFTIAAIFRDYTFVASSYLLEPCWENWNKLPDQSYGLGRDLLPKSVARPMYRCAQILDLPPFMSYAASYALFNYTLADPAKGLDDYSNLRLVRAFEKGLDPKSSEAGFILTHVDMVKYTGSLINGVLRVVDNLEQNGPRQDVNDGFRLILETMEKIEAAMETMWGNSKPADYLSFRVFIFGITNQSMFPNGVIYDGVEDNKPLHFRGESGANDSIVNPSSRPSLRNSHARNTPNKNPPRIPRLQTASHREFLTYIREKSVEIGVRDYCVQDSETAVLFLKVLNHVRSFRWRHWLFAREYIIRRTPHPTATGGSPIVTWLPNQLSAVMDLMVTIYDTYLSPKEGVVAIHGSEDLIASHRKQVEPMMELVRDQKDKLAKEVEKWCQERGV
ncbi:Indoleamine 2-3-dioxygenase [Penicillium cosmopolitanum]|uniref:Indoleamine 2,3-dioxygenase n=1 Tax=Penicillium cosmopolitanum TaxID=1131564 RepID=A0A9W9VBR9_9EURO|nr:Indoleamine 2-3-dioxygenase [Penicillium cosmopolitanum]KAJ5376283.1 Indoleamine 2-3-dioxygenase [Penicillium cosmopolitanum]